MFEIMNGRTRLYQWDAEQRILMDCPAVREVHWCNANTEKALVTVVKMDSVTKQSYAEVPNILLQTSGPLEAFAMSVSGNEKYVQAHRVYHVHDKQKPDGYVYTETEVLNYSALDARLYRLETSGIGGIYPATDERLGGVKIGSGLNVTEDGTISLRYAVVSNDKGGNTVTIG